MAGRGVTVILRWDPIRCTCSAPHTKYQAITSHDRLQSRRLLSRLWGTMAPSAGIRGGQASAISGSRQPRVVWAQEWPLDPWWEMVTHPANAKWWTRSLAMASAASLLSFWQFWRQHQDRANGNAPLCGAPQVALSTQFRDARLHHPAKLSWPVGGPGT